MELATALAFALAARSHILSPSDLEPYLPAMLGLIGGGMFSALYGARLVQRLTAKKLVQVVAVLVGAIGILLLVEAALPFQQLHFLPSDAIAHAQHAVNESDAGPQRKPGDLHFRQSANLPFVSISSARCAAWLAGDLVDSEIGDHRGPPQTTPGGDGNPPGALQSPRPVE